MGNQNRTDNSVLLFPVMGCLTTLLFANSIRYGYAPWVVWLFLIFTILLCTLGVYFGRIYARERGTLLAKLTPVLSGLLLAGVLIFNGLLFWGLSRLQ